MSRTYALVIGLDRSNVVILQILNAVGDPSHSIFDASWDIAICLMRFDGHEKVWEVLNGQSKIGSGTFLPLIEQRDVVDAMKVNGIKSTSDCRPS